jgi:hypothetical protein
MTAALSLMLMSIQAENSTDFLLRLICPETFIADGVLGGFCEVRQSK